jgi:DNA-binding IclR family transcriptional regulator
MPADARSTLARHHLDVGADYVLRSAGLLSSVFDGDILRGLVFLSALRLSAHAPQDAGGERPVRLTAIARSVGLPIETTRRHLLKLQRDGFVVRAGAGGGMIAIIPERPDIAEAMAANSANLASLAAAMQVEG